MKVMVSACLLGTDCKYSGGNNRHSDLLHRLIGQEVIPICPEVMGGLPTPRVPAEIVQGTVMTRDGRSVDAEYRRGAEEALRLARLHRPDVIILQSRSPSCGVKQIYDGTFSGIRVDGMGVTARLLRDQGFRVVDIEDLEEAGL